MGVQPSRTIALVDPFWSGHHPTYIKLFAKTILSLDYSVMAFCPNPHEIQEWVTVNCQPNRGSFHGYELHEPEPSRFTYEPVQLALNGLGMWRSAAKAIKKARRETGANPDLVFLPWLDSYLGFYKNRRIVDLLFPYDWTGLFFHPWFLRQYGRVTDIRETPTDRDAELLAGRCRGVGLLDEGVADLMRERLTDKPIVVFPDVADSSIPDRDFPLLRDVVAKAAGRRIVSLLGGVAKRKGILTLLEAASQMRSDECFFLVAGALVEKAFDPVEVATVRRIAADPPQNCFLHLGFIPGEAQFNALVEISDILFAAYEEFPHSSNILTKAALFEKPVVVSKGYCMEERVKAFRMGECIDEGDVSECIAAIRRLLQPGETLRDFSGYRNLHSEERFRSSIKKILMAGSNL